MKNKKLLIVGISLLAFLGVAALATSNKFVVGTYILLSCPLLFAVAVGGITAYWHQDIEDYKEIKDEELRLHIEKIRVLEQQLYVKVLDPIDPGLGK